MPELSSLSSSASADSTGSIDGIGTSAGDRVETGAIGWLAIRSGRFYRLPGLHSVVMARQLFANPDEDRIKRFGIVDRQLRQALAIELNLGQLEPMDQA